MRLPYSIRKTKGIAITIICTFAFNLALTQNSMPAINSPVPVSPNAASLGKYGEIPVGYYTGIPNISIPVYDIQSGSLKLPVNLSYHAGGMRVEEVASWVGLGWSLNAGGIITRQVRGIPDEGPNGYLSTYTKIDSFYNSLMNSTDRQNYLDAIGDGTMDSQQDMYTYNFIGETGKFVFTPGGTILSIPVSKNKFEFGSFLGKDSSWKVTGTDGTIYYFTTKENTSSTSVTNGSAGSTTAGISSWYITRIVNATSTDSLTFTYDGAFNSFNTGIAQTKYVLNYEGSGACTAKDPDNSYSLNYILGQRISAINFKNGNIHFYKKSATRDDYPSDYAIDSIVIANNDNSYYKKLRFYQSYNTGSGSYGTPTEELKRLFLDSVTIYGKEGRIGAYSLVYNQTTSFPARNSFNQDHWGYYNGSSNSSSFVPTSNLVYTDSICIVVSGANRNVDTSINQLGTLSSIKYPTGGHTDFEYETNKIINLPKGQDFITGYDNFLTTTSYSGSFSINDDFAGTGGVNATISINNGGGACAMGTSFGCPIVTVSGPSGTFNVFDNVTRYLRKGTYSVNVDLTGVTDPDIIGNFSLYIIWGKSAFSDSFFKYNTNVGGLRIKKITNYVAGSTKADIRKFTYLIPDTTNRSSGYLLSFPSYQGSSLFHNRSYDMGGYTYYDCGYVTLNSSSNYPLLSSQGSNVNYKYVQEYLGENGEFGKNEYTYTAPDSYPDLSGTTFPFAPANSQEWKRGQLVKTKSYKYDPSSGSYTLIQEKSNTYSNNVTNNLAGLKIGQKIVYAYSPPLGNKEYETARFDVSTGWFPIASETTRIYDQNNSGIYSESVVNYSYGSNHYWPTSTSTTNSKGETVVSSMKYPLDYGTLTGGDVITTGINNLKTKNLLSPVIEKYTQVGGDSRTTQAIFTAYKSSTPLPETIYAIELAKPTTSFSASSVSSGSIVKDGLYQQQVSFNAYDSYGNIQEQQKNGDAKHAYIWDYNAAYPIAEVTNSDKDNIACTSFEADGTGNWSGISSGSVITSSSSPTGGKYYTLTGSTLQRSSLSSGATYIVSYWSSTGNYYTVSGTISSSKKGATVNGWTYCEHEVTGASTISISGTGNIDELRLYPKGALMSTRTYIPLAGVSSECDPSNKVTRYEYDSIGRLLLIKDKDGNIIKSFDYKFQ